MKLNIVKTIFFLMGWLTFTLSSPVSADLPPRPIPPASAPTASQPQEPVKGAMLMLVVPTHEQPDVTQESWTQVQWLDENGRWHNVDGWGGTPTFNATTNSFEVEWWVDEKHFSTGPFRWTVTPAENKRYLNRFSTPFDLPSQANTIKKISLLP